MSKAKEDGTTTMLSIMEMMAVEKRKRATSAELNKAALIEAVKSSKLTRIEVEFSGGGDSGQIDEVRYFVGKKQPDDVDTLKKRLVQQGQISDTTTWDAEKEEWVSTTKSPTLEELVEQICYDLLAANHGGWEINEGSYGEFVFSFGEGNKVDLTFNQRVESVETSEEVY